MVLKPTFIIREPCRMQRNPFKIRKFLYFKFAWLLGELKMNLKTKMLCAFTVFLFLGSLAFGSVSASYIMLGTANSDQLIPAETYGDDRRNEAVSILVYSEVADTDIDEEWDHVMTSLINSLHGQFTYDNLTDYTQLSVMIDEFDVLLLLESENANYTFVDMVAAAWSGILPSYVQNGGIVISMAGYAPVPVQYGLTPRILNITGLMPLYNLEYAATHQIDVFDVNDALALNVDSSYTGVSATMGFDIPDAVKVMEDNTNAKSVVAHKIIGKGHVVYLGFDMFGSNINQDRLLANAVRLHKHVIFDSEHAAYDILGSFDDFATDLQYYGFAVSNMPNFNAGNLTAADILVLSRGGVNYTTDEINTIENFVVNGGGLFVIDEYGGFGDTLDPVIARFGYTRNTTSYILDTDDNAGSTSRPVYDGSNIKPHSITIDVNHVEAYGGIVFIETPANSFNFIVTDSDGTAEYNQGPTSITEELPIGVASHHDMGRVVVWSDTNNLLNGFDTDLDGTENFLDGDNEVMARNIIRWLSAAGIPEQTVVFDESHAPWGSVHGLMNSLATFMVLNGYNVEWMTTFSPTTIAGADILVIIDGSISYSPLEIAFLEGYVANGGALLLWGNYVSLVTEVDPIGQEFGLHINITGYIEDSDDYESATYYVIYDGANIGTHPIMDGVDRLEVFVGGAFNSIGTGTALVSTDNDGTSTWDDGSPAGNLAVYAATTYDMGKVVFLTDIDLAIVTTDGDGDGFGGLYDSDNSIFVGNVLKWLGENRAPTVEVVSPNGGEVLNGTATIEWDAVDFDNDSLTCEVWFSDNGGTDWTLIDTVVSISEFQWNTTSLDDGTNYMVRVVVSDGLEQDSDDSDAVFELDNRVSGGFPIDTNTLLIIIGVVLILVIIIVIAKRRK